MSAFYPISGGGGGAPSGPAGGDLSGTYPNPTVGVIGAIDGSALTGRVGHAETLEWEFKQATIGSPGSGEFHTNSAAYGSTNELKFSEVPHNVPNSSSFFPFFAALPVGSRLVVTNRNNGEAFSFLYTGLDGDGHITVTPSGYGTGTWEADGYYSFAFVPGLQTKTQVGLGDVDNTSDANKPVSSATQTALDNKLDKDGNIADTSGFNSDMEGLVTIETAEATSGITPCSDGTVSPVISITTVKGIITAIS